MMKEKTFTREEIARPFIVHHKHFDKPSYVSGSVVGYKSKISITRYMDDIDYVGFLNGNMKKRK